MNHPPTIHRARRLRVAAALTLALTVSLSACGADDVRSPSTMRNSVALSVIDAGGDPVAGLDVDMAVLSSLGLQRATVAAAQAAKAATVMEVVLPVSILGLPAVSVPAGFGPGGLPMGMQLIGRHGDDLGLLQLAEAWHQATPFARQRPPLTA